MPHDGGSEGVAGRLIALGEAAMSLTHESRGALQRAQCALEEVERGCGGRAELAEPVARLRDALDELRELHEHLTELAKPRTRMSLQSVDLSRVFSQAWDDLRLLRRGREVHLEIVGTWPWCRVDPAALRRVFRNLLDNAIAMSADPVRIFVELDETSLGDASLLRVLVRDDGPGLAAEQIERAFRPFQSGRPAGTGLGLGLAIARRIVEGHGGRLTARPGPGGCFELLLPKVPPVGCTQFV